jgi:hypothetical protein
LITPSTDVWRFFSQIRKGELEEIVVDEGKATKHFEKMALKDIFILRL